MGGPMTDPNKSSFEREIKLELRVSELEQQLAAMTAERDEACGELLVSLDDAPIGSLAGKLVTANRVLRSHLATLQATLAERDAYKAVLQGAEYEQVDKIGTLSVEVAQRIGVTAAHRTKEIVAQLAASQQRVRELELDVTHRDRTVQEHIAKQQELQATLAEREELVEGLKTELEEYRSLAEKLGAEKAISERDLARQDAARLREAAQNLTCEVCKMDMQKALKGA